LKQTCESAGSQGHAMRQFCSMSVMFAAVLGSPALPAAEFFGPVPYASAADTPAGFATGPTAIEDFEDGTIDPRLITDGVVIGPGGLTDSVDVDDGALDGSGTSGRSLFGLPRTISFSAPFPSSAGMVWTDGGGSTTVTFEAFDANGVSLGTIVAPGVGDSSNTGDTAEDRFFGVRHAGGIRTISLNHTNGGLEVDHVQFSLGVEAAIASTLEDGSLGVLLPTPSSGSPATPQTLFALPVGARPHGAAFRGGAEALFADFAAPLLHRAALVAPGTVETLTLTGRSSGNGTLAAAPDGRFVLSIGEQGGSGEAVVLDFATSPPTVTPIAPTLRVLSFVTAAVDFAPDGRAFVCHTSGVSVLRPPYTTVDFTMPFPTITQSPSMCRLTRDGARLFVTRMLSETVPTVNAVRTTTAPFSASSQFVAMPAPADVQGLGPMAVAPDGQALLVAQQFLFPQAPNPPKARVFVLRAPFDGQTSYQELTLPSEVAGTNCSAEGNPIDCPGFEHVELSHDGRLAILTGNSSAELSGVPDRAPALFIDDPFDDAARRLTAVQIAPTAPVPGRGTGAVRFLPIAIFADGLERRP
jgi:hypothetical protein